MPFYTYFLLDTGLCQIEKCHVIHQICKPVWDMHFFMPIGLFYLRTQKSLDLCNMLGSGHRLDNKFQEDQITQYVYCSFVFIFAKRRITLLFG